MKAVVNNIFGFLLACASALAIAAAGDGNVLAPEPQVSVGWVWFFLAVFVGICAWFGFAIWRADRKSRNEAEATGTNKS